MAVHGCGMGSPRAIGGPGRYFPARSLHDGGEYYVFWLIRGKGKMFHF